MKKRCKPQQSQVEALCRQEDIRRRQEKGDNSIWGERVSDGDRALVRRTRQVECGRAGETRAFNRRQLQDVSAAGTVILVSVYKT